MAGEAKQITLHFRGELVKVHNHYNQSRKENFRTLEEEMLFALNAYAKTRAITTQPEPELHFGADGTASTVGTTASAE